MKTKIAINGFGRIGRNAFKIAREREDLEIVAINDLTDTATLAHLLRYDTNYGRYGRQVEVSDDGIVVDGQVVRILAERDPSKLPWGEMEIDIVIESTGRFTKTEDARQHVMAGAKRVVLSAPAKSAGAKTYVLGVNDAELAEAGEVVSNASCTTNCVAPVSAVMEESFGIDRAMLTTVHSYTASQMLQDGPAKDLREARAAAENIIPTTTGAAIAAAEALPSLAGKFTGLSIRVPTPVVSLIDVTYLLKRETTVEEINAAFITATQQPNWDGILGVTDEPLVTKDFVGDSRSAIVDLSLTDAVGGNLVKVVAWYDNEWGYCNRLVELVARLGNQT
ncbi:MAG: type I glyceraldehyde-3-phosphate dehydrogenase [Candidatus Saccharimonadales bacterium]